jgi:hypothetical protein
VLLANQGRLYGAGVVAAVQIVTTYGVDPAIMRYIPGNQYFVRFTAEKLLGHSQIWRFDSLF